jgi:hypothetical protein
LTPNPTIPTFAFDTVCHPWADELGWTGEFSVTSLHPFKNEQAMDYSKFLYDPFSKDTVSQLEQYEEFQFGCKDKSKVVAYLILMYDINNTDYRRAYSDLYERKHKCAITAGFELDESGHFEPDIESILIGENDQFNDAMARYISLFNIPDLPAHTAFTEILAKECIAAQKEKDSKVIKDVIANINNARKNVEDCEVRIFTNIETENVRKALYRFAQKKKLGLRPEEKAREIKDKKLNVPDVYNLMTDGKKKK